MSIGIEKKIAEKIPVEYKKLGEITSNINLSFQGAYFEKSKQKLGKQRSKYQLDLTVAFLLSPFISFELVIIYFYNIISNILKL